MLVKFNTTWKNDLDLYIVNFGIIICDMFFYIRGYLLIVVRGRPIPCSKRYKDNIKSSNIR